MNTRVKSAILTLSAITFSILTLTSVSANYDYVCRLETSSCDCTWDDSWSGTGSKRCVGTQSHYTVYGNTRVGCPSATLTNQDTMSVPLYVTDVSCKKYESNDDTTWVGNTVLFTYSTAESESSEVPDLSRIQTPTWYAIRGQYDENDTLERWVYSKDDGDGVYYPVIGECSATVRTSRTIEKNISAHMTALSGFNYGYRVTGSNACEMTISDNIAPTANITVETLTTASGSVRKATVHCTDSGSTWDMNQQLFGNSGCNSVDSPITFPTSDTTSHILGVSDKAGNETKCSFSVAANGNVSSNCTSTTIDSRITGDNPTCTLADGVTPCSTDVTPPVAKISYSPNTCTNQPVTVKNTCLSDAESGCRPEACVTDANGITNCTPSTVGTTSVSIPSNSNGSLGIADVAGNLTNLFYTIDRIDTTKPAITTLYTEPQEAGDILLVAGATDTTPASDLCKGPLNYSITVDGTSYEWGITSDGTLASILLPITRAGEYTAIVTVRDAAGNISDTRSIPLVVVPGNPHASKSSITRNTEGGTKYGNAVDAYTYTITLRDQYENTLYAYDTTTGNHVGVNIDSVAQNPSASTIRLLSNDPTSESALIVTSSTTTNTNGEVNLQVQSYAPGVFDEGFQISAKGVNISLSTNASNSFKKPLTAHLEIDAATSPLRFGVNAGFTLVVTNPGSVNKRDLMFDALSNAITTSNEGESIIVPGSLVVNTPTDQNPTFSITLNSKDTDSARYISPGITLSPITIHYRVGDKTVSYILTSNESNGKFTYIASAGSSGISISGQLQSNNTTTSLANSELTSVVNVAGFTARAAIKQTAYEAIRGLTPWKVTNKIYYAEGDISIGSITESYETLIVRNGNVIIGSDVNVDALENRGIIVLRDDTSSKDTGNVLVRPNVRFIQATIYADGSILSSTDNRGTRPTDSELGKQLVIKGSLFTRNTIGGAIRGDTGYKLPGDVPTTDFNEAKKYDLAFLRAGNQGNTTSYSDGGTRPYNENKTTSTVILYNPSLGANPPKGFGK